MADIDVKCVTAANGWLEIELRSRLVEFDLLEQTETLESRLQLWRAGELVAEQTRRLRHGIYFPQEVLDLLQGAGFHESAMESGYSGRPAVPDDGTVTFVARKDRT